MTSQKPWLEGCPLAQCNPTGAIFCAQVFTVRAQPFCTEIDRIALPARCWIFVLGLVLLPVDADSNQAKSATHCGRILEHNSDNTRFRATLMGLGASQLGTSIPTRGSEHKKPVGLYVAYF